VKASQAIDRVRNVVENNNGFFEGKHADLLALIPLLILTVLLYLVERKDPAARSNGG